MTRLPGSLVLMLVVAASAVLAQAPVPPPIPGAQRPGAPPQPLPPRDRTAAPPATGTAVMRGRVLAVNGMALRRAQVDVVGAELGLQQRHGTTTDVDGKWEITDLPAGRYTVSASKAGYVTIQYGQRRPFEQGTPVVVADAATVERLDVTLQRGAVIAGRILDEFGEPMAQIGVQAMRYSYSNDGQRRLNAVSGAATDDLGQFRVFGLMPGDYVLQASSGPVMLGLGGGPARNSFATTYYPGTLNADEAQTVTLTLGQETSLPFQLVSTSSKTSRVTGVVVNADGAPVVGLQLSLVTPMGGNGWSSSSAGSTGADGTFTITSVTPGEHTINGRSARLTEGADFANYTFKATGESVTARIVTSKGTTLSGRVVWDGNASRGTTPVRVQLQQEVAQGMPFLGGSVPGADGTLNEDNTFKLVGATGKGFIRPLQTPAGWAIKSVTVDGDDVTDVPIDLSSRASIDDIRVELTDKLTDLTGTVTDSRGTPLKDYVVILLPAGLKEGLSTRRFISMLRPDQNGSFKTKGMPPGRYTATALEWVEQGRQFVPTFQEQLRKAGKAVTLRDGEPMTIDLKLTEGL